LIQAHRFKLVVVKENLACSTHYSLGEETLIKHDK